MKFCRCCNEIEVFRHVLYCDKCRETIKTKGAMRYKVGKITLWIRGNQIIRAIENGKDIQAVYERKEVIE